MEEAEKIADENRSVLIYYQTCQTDPGQVGSGDAVKGWVFFSQLENYLISFSLLPKNIIMRRMLHFTENLFHAI